MRRQTREKVKKKRGKKKRGKGKMRSEIYIVRIHGRLALSLPPFSFSHK